MNIFRRSTGFSGSRLGKQILVSLLSLGLLFATWPQSLTAYQGAPPPQEAGPAPPYVQQTPEQLQQLVAPIALYPDSLVAQILAASTFPEQVVEADRWLQEHQGLQGRGFGASCGPTTLGPERQGAHRISIRPWKYGQEPLLDVISGRRLLQPASGGDGCRPGDAPARGASRQSSDHAAANCNEPRLDDRRATCQPRYRLCPRV